MPTLQQPQGQDRLRLLDSKTAYNYRTLLTPSGDFIPGPMMSKMTDPKGYKPAFVYLLTRFELL